MKTELLPGLIVFLFLAALVLPACQKDDTNPEDGPISTTYEIVKIDPSKHHLNDGSIEVKFADSEYRPEIKLRKDNYIGYKEVSSEYYTQGLGSGMYLLEIGKDPDSVLIDTVFLSSCDTIVPSDYFPIYPGSYWIYDNSDTLLCGEEYNLIGLGHTYSGLSQTHGDPPNEPSFPVDSIYVPSADVASQERAYNFYHYSLLLDKDLNLTRYLPIVNEEEGYSIKQWDDGRYDFDYNAIAILKVDTTLYIDNILYENVIIAEHFNMPDLVGDRESHYSFATKRLYFSKNIGLIRSVAYVHRGVVDNQAVIDTITINLADYFINSN